LYGGIPELIVNKFNTVIITFYKAIHNRFRNTGYIFKSQITVQIIIITDNVVLPLFIKILNLLADSHNMDVTLTILFSIFTGDQVIGSLDHIHIECAGKTPV